MVILLSVHVSCINPLEAFLNNYIIFTMLCVPNITKFVGFDTVIY